MATRRARFARSFNTGPSLQPLAVRREDAAKMLGVSLRHFERHIQPNVRTVAIGRTGRDPRLRAGAIPPTASHLRV
jgi:hypothetical protein